MKVLGLIVAALACASAPTFSVRVAQSAEFPKSGLIAARGLAEKDFPRWKAIEPNIYTYEDTHTPDPDGSVIGTVSLIIVTKDGVILCDGQGDPMDGQRLVDTIKKITPLPLKYVVVASDHIDHVGGNAEIKAAWPGAVFISSPASQKVLAKAPVVPSETVSDKRVITLGGTEFQIINLGRAHTGGDLVVYLPQTKVLFLGEVYARGMFPSQRSSFPSEWVATLKKAKTMDVSWYVPGHGFVDGKAELRADLEDSLKIQEYIVTEGKRLHALGLPCSNEGTPPVCEAAKQVNWGPFATVAQTRSKQDIAINRVYMELEGKLPK